MKGCGAVWCGALAKVRGGGEGVSLAVEGNTACGEAEMKKVVCVSHLFLPLVNKGF